MQTGASCSLVDASHIVVAVSLSIASGHRRSVQARPTPPEGPVICLVMRRNARSQYPAMGARRRLFSSSTLPILNMRQIIAWCAVC